MCILSEESHVFLYVAYVAGIVYGILTMHKCVSFPLFLITVALLFYFPLDAVYGDLVFGEIPDSLPAPSRIDLMRMNTGTRQQVRALAVATTPDLATKMKSGAASFWELEDRMTEEAIKTAEAESSHKRNKLRRVSERFEKARTSVSWLNS